ncbi:ThiF family adenylyltransferase [Sorangium sp. So ce363]|uniref:ThiF family adenylyltransferase n=1 Tax=Sorangium sp. So ce363 TaxID=3133304 RepID=UPI003F63C99D
MSLRLTSRSPDLARLRAEGYEIEIKAGHLLVKNVPYVNSKREVRRGTLVSELTLAGDTTARPSTHVAHFIGEHPCNKDGSEIEQIKHSSSEQLLANEVRIQHTFSSKPRAGYVDYFEKMTTYVAIVSSPAHSLDPTVTARTHIAVDSDDEDSVFHYVDTASTRAGIWQVSQKLNGHKVAIVGLGGTGSYVLDLVAKTPVAEIHLFDGDDLLQHNAFRSPGAPSIDELRAKPRKVDHFGQLYSKMRKGIVSHAHHLEPSNVHELDGMSFVFICIDKAGAKPPLIEKLEIAGVPFIDVGMGVQLVDDGLLGVLRVTTSTPTKREHVRERHRISFRDAAGDDYARNIQIADLNALNAALAVVKWKKLCGFYQDREREHFSTYTIDVNMLTSDDGG